MITNQLLYLLYGDKKTYLEEAKFSILSALRHQKDAASFVITIMTDQPDAFKDWPVRVFSLDAETLTAWVGTSGYYHRRKACAIQAGVKLAEKTIFIDTDTVFLKDPAELFPRVSDDQFLMDELEWTWAKGSQRKEYRAFAQELASRNETPAPGLKLYNSGIFGMTKANGAMMDGVLRLIDQWAHHGKELLTIEQIAASFMLDGKKVVEANDCINHYFAAKRFHHAMLKVFFETHGDAYHDNLAGLAGAVPGVMPKNSLPSLLRMKWLLKWKKGTSRKVAKFYLLGKQQQHCVYLKACRSIWWEKAIEEMRLIESDYRKLEELNSFWMSDREFLGFADSLAA
jgi:hypothetical protein